MNDTAAARTSSDRGSRGTRGERFAGIERLRLVGAIGIVWFHVGAPGGSIGYGGLVLFVALMVALSSRERAGSRADQIVRDRARRLLIPWVFWTGVFAAAKIAQALSQSRPIASEFEWEMLLYGTSLHLWYLPFAFVASAGVAIMGSRGWLGQGRARALAWCTAAVALGFVGAWVSSTGFSQAPFAQWVYVSSAVAIGLAIAATPGEPPAPTWLLVVALAVVIASLAPTLMEPGGWQVSLAVGGLAATLAWGGRAAAGGVAVWLGSLAFGVYLVHPLVAALLLRSDSGFENPTQLALGTAVLSIALTAAIRATPLRVVT